MKNSYQLGPTSLRVLAYLMGRPGHPLTVRELAPLLGRHYSAMQQSLARLRRLGLVRYDAGHVRTARACCRFIPAAELFGRDDTLPRKGDAVVFRPPPERPRQSAEAPPADAAGPPAAHPCTVTRGAEPVGSEGSPERAIALARSLAVTGPVGDLVVWDGRDVVAVVRANSDVIRMQERYVLPG